MPPNILLITHPGTGVALRRTLDTAGHRVQPSHTIASACESLERCQVDLVLVDLGPSDMDGVVALQALRARTSAVIVLIESGPPADLDQMLASGADDFLSKPFSPIQLSARVSVALKGRRAGAIVVGGLRVDPLRRRAWLDGCALDLSRREFDMLACLASRAGEVVPRKDLARSVWPQSTLALNRSIDVHLSWLRRKLGDAATHPRYLHTIRGVGFRLGPDAGATRNSAASAR